MKKASFSLMDKNLNLDQIEGKYSAFAKVPYAIPVRMSKPLAPNGYGRVTVDGIEISRGKTFLIDVMVKTNCLLIPVGEVAKEYGKEYSVHFEGFVAEDGSSFKEQTFSFKTLPRGKRKTAYKEHDQLALQAAREGIVLLKNENSVLPLKEDSVLNCYGAAQYMFRNTSTGASLIHPRWQANFHQAVEEHSSFRINKEISGIYGRLQEVTPTPEQMDQAFALNETALIFISRASGEFLDNKPAKGGYYLTDEELSMIQAVSGRFTRKVAIINTGYPIEMKWVDTYGIDAVIYTGFAGQGAGYALVEILDGRTNPSGKLPDSVAFDYYDYPSAKNFINFKEEDKLPGEKDYGVHLYYEEDIYVGYRYFDTFDKPVAYSFGHGLSYTSFSIEASEVSFENGKLHAAVRVKNTGEVSGREVVQLYVHAPEGKIEKPNRVLAAFGKTRKLAAGEEQTLKLSAGAMNFASFEEETGCYLLECGEYKVFCGNSLSDSRYIASFQVAKTQNLREVNRVNLPVEPFHRLTKKEPWVGEDSKMVPLAEAIPVPAKRPKYHPQGLEAYSGEKITFPELKRAPKRLDSFVAQLSDKELCKLNVCGGADWYMPWGDGSAGKVNTVDKYKMPKMKVSDGNTGLNIKKPNIGFPSSTVVAASFNKKLAYRIGKAIGEESKENGIAVNLGPGMNIHRNILNGRHPEYFSEDPLLAGTMAGFHGKGLEDAGVGCTYKHLFCNNSDTSRKGSHSIVSERALREIYYKVFETAMAIQMPTCVMTSYNCVNGIYPAENADVLQKLVRGEWHFDGFIMTDWGTYDTVDPVEMVKAGNCWLTEGNAKYVKILYQAVKDGRLSRNVLQQNVRFLVKMLLKST
ncbi:MAG: glycoside hydrolase family 3 C-terminal domain-containing protein [Eubacterium sp.]|nr:glycoside hydrolase family 3 C-terminal domain-containing protein [Eubacterium sp.]